MPRSPRYASCPLAGPSFPEVLDPAVRHVMVIGVALAVFQQVTGINTIIYYAPTLSAAGLGNSAALLANIVNGAVNVAMTIVAIRLLDRAGRRPLLLGGTTGMAAGMIVVALTFAIGGSQLHGGTAYIAIAGLLIYTGSFAIGLGPVFWLLISEIYPVKIRGQAMSVATMANWGANFVVTISFLTLLSAIGNAGTFFLFAGLRIVALASSSGRCRRPRTAACRTSNETSTCPRATMTCAAVRHLRKPPSTGTGPLAERDPSPSRITRGPASYPRSVASVEKERRNLRQLAWSLIPGGMSLVAASFFGSSWYLAQRIRSEALAVGPGPAMPAYDDVRFVGVAPGQVQLRAVGDQPTLLKPMLYGIAWPGGTGHLGAVASVSESPVTRPLTVISGSAPTMGSSLRSIGRTS